MMSLIYEDDADAIDIMSEGAEIQDLFAERVAAAGPGAQSYLKVIEDDDGLGRFGRSFRGSVRKIKRTMRPVRDAGYTRQRRQSLPWARGVKHSAAVASRYASRQRLLQERARAAAQAARGRVKRLAPPPKRIGRVDTPERLAARERAARAQHVAHAKKILDKYGMMSDYLQVEGTDFDEMGGAWDFLKIIGMKIGLHDPINYYEPGKSLSEVYAKYKALTQEMANRIAKLGTVKHREPLMVKLRTLVNDLNRVAPAFRGASKPGQRDRDRLAAAVQAARFLRREMFAAERAYGIRVPGEPEPPPPEGAKDPNPIVIPIPDVWKPPFPLTPPPGLPQREEAEGMSTTNMMLIGGGTLAALLLVMQMGKKKR